MRKNIVILMLLLSSKGFAISSDTTKPIMHKTDTILPYKFNFKESSGIIGFFRMNYNKLNFDYLNSALNNNTFISPRTPQLSMGAGGTIVLFWLTLGGEWQTLIPQSIQYNVVTSGSIYLQKNTYGGGYGLFNIGANVLSRKHLFIHPELGIGGGHIYALSETANGYPFNASNPGVSQKVVIHSFMLNPKICFDALIGNAFVLGIQVGYNYMTTYKWKVNDVSYSNGPKSNLNGIYAGITIGIGASTDDGPPDNKESQENL